MTRTTRNFYLLTSACLILTATGCAPHGDMSRITRVGGGTAEISLPSLFGGKVKSQVSSGSSSNQVTAGNYKVNLNVGSSYTQTATTTGDNYKVYTSFNKKIAK
jgi:hypothetical protein